MNTNQKKVPLGVYKAGQSFGENAIIVDSLRVATSICKEKAHVLELSKEAFQKLLVKNMEMRARDFVVFGKRYHHHHQIRHHKVWTFCLLFVVCLFDHF